MVWKRAPRPTVGTRLAFGFGLVIAIVAVTIAIAIPTTNEARVRTTQVNVICAPAAMASQRLYAAAVGSANALRGYIVTHDPSLRAEWRDHWRDIDREVAILDRLSRGYADPELRRQWAELRQALPAFKAAQTEVLQVAVTSPPEVTAGLLSDRVLPQFARIHSLMVGADGAGGVVGNQTRRLTANLASASSSVRRANFILLMGSIGMLGAAGLAAHLTTRSIRAPLEQLTAVLQMMARGEFEVEVPHVLRRDEIGDVARAAAVFRQNGIERDRLSHEVAGVQAELDRIYECAPVGLALVDCGLRYVRVNSAYAAITGLAEDAHIGRTVEDALPQVARHLTTSLLEVTRTGTTVRDLEAEGETAAQPGVKRAWTHDIVAVRDSDGTVNSLLVSVHDITRRKRAEAQAQLVREELNHRVKNALATVQSIAAQTLRRHPDLRGFRAAFDARLAALSATHDLLTSGCWRGANLLDLLQKELKPYEVEGCAQFTGDPVRLNSQAALALGLIIHELTTNAAKYGALSVERGRVTVQWTRVDDALTLLWDESGGPLVQPPQANGFGSRLIERSVAGDLGGEAELSFAPEGFSCKIIIPLQAIAL